MNERIEKLWDEAADSIAAIPIGRNNFWETQEIVMEKFAELIVRECGLLADQYQFEKNTPNPLRVKRLDLVPSEFIKKHFGVEE